MAGGRFDVQVGKIRPGTYVDISARTENSIGLSERGVVAISLPLNWGPVKSFFEIKNIDKAEELKKLGYSVIEDNETMIYIREALKKALKVLVYRLAGGSKAKATNAGLTITALHEGTRGNDIKLAIIANPVNGYDVKVYLEELLIVEYLGVTTIGSLIEANANDWVVFSGVSTEELVAVAGVSLTGGTDNAVVNSDVTDFLDDAEVETWNTMCFQYTDKALQTSLIAKIKYFRDGIGKAVSAVAPSCNADYEGILSVDNGVVLSDGRVITKEQACAWVAGADASATNVDSNTYVIYDSAIDVSNKKNSEEAEQSIRNGQIFFSLVNSDVVLEYDINTLKTFTKDKTSDYRKNRVRRVLDTFNESLQLNFRPNKFDNGPTGWDLMESLGKQILTVFELAGAIRNVNYDEDFIVDRIVSKGDETYLSVGIMPVDSSEKLYFTVKTR